MIKGSAKSMMIRGLKCAPVTEGGGGDVVVSWKAAL